MKLVNNIKRARGAWNQAKIAGLIEVKLKKNGTFAKRKDIIPSAKILNGS